MACGYKRMHFVWLLNWSERGDHREAAYYTLVTKFELWALRLGIPRRR